MYLDMKRILLLLILLPVAIILKGQANIEDSLALVALYNSTNGPTWNNHENWLEPGKLVSEWHGVYLYGNGRVRRINLSFNNLDGELPAEFWALDTMDYFNFQDNKLTGTISEDIGNFSNLEYIILENNLLTGSIPNTISNAGNLIGIHIFNNKLSGILPEGLGDLQKLESLMCYQNQLTGPLPAGLATLQYLEELFIDDNFFHGPMPSGIADLPALRYAYFGNNSFTFTDLQQFVGNTLEDFGYWPQHQVNTNTHQVNSATGENLELDITQLTLYESATANNQYQWWKDGSSVTSSSSSPLYSLAGLDDSDRGYYYCVMTNSDWPGLELTTDSIKLVIDGPTDLQLSQNTVDENSTPATVIGTITVIDPDQEGGHTLNFAEGDGENDADNSLFTLNAENLQINVSPDFETQENYHIYLSATDNDAQTLDMAFEIQVNDLPEGTSIDEIGVGHFNIYPNPSLGSSTIEFSLTVGDNISIEIRDTQGKLIESFSGYYTAGKHMINFDLSDKVQAGVYLYRIKTDNFTDTKLCILH